jgi:hypothetical protein
LIESKSLLLSSPSQAHIYVSQNIIALEHRKERHVARMKVNPAPLHTAQLAIIGLSAAMSVAILGTAAHTLDVFNKQQSSNPWWLPLWPQHFDTHGTKALVGSSTTTFILCAVLLVLTFLPQVSK